MQETIYQCLETIYQGLETFFASTDSFLHWAKLFVFTTEKDKHTLPILCK